MSKRSGRYSEDEYENKKYRRGEYYAGEDEEIEDGDDGDDGEDGDEEINQDEEEYEDVNHEDNFSLDESSEDEEIYNVVRDVIPNPSENKLYYLEEYLNRFPDLNTGEIMKLWTNTLKYPYRHDWLKKLIERYPYSDMLRDYLSSVCQFILDGKYEFLIQRYFYSNKVINKIIEQMISKTNYVSTNKIKEAIDFLKNRFINQIYQNNNNSEDEEDFDRELMLQRCNEIIEYLEAIILTRERNKNMVDLAYLWNPSNPQERPNKTHQFIDIFKRFSREYKKGGGGRKRSEGRKRSGGRKRGKYCDYCKYCKRCKDCGRRK